VSIRNLDAALEPGAVAVVGDDARAETVLANITAGGFRGAVRRVAPDEVSDLPETPDLAVVTTPAAAVPGAISALGARGCRVAAVLTEGVSDATGLRQAMLDAARPHLLRIVGPNTLGLIVPPARLNASLAPAMPEAGGLALVSQSAAIATSLIDWAADHGIGFSQILALGDMADVDVGDGLDLLASDGRTRAILLYVETVPEARKFLSAARAAARVKPVIAIKAGRSPEAARAAATHTGALSGADAVVDAAMRRAGILRVRGLGELFAAAETLARFRPLPRSRLGIVTNGGGAGVLAVDGVAEAGGELADLSTETIAALDAVLPPGWSRANPVDIGADAAPECYVAALDALAADSSVDALLAMNCPSALGRPIEAAQAVAGAVRRGMISNKPVLACWMGGGTARAARAVLRERGVASYDAPAAAAAALGYLAGWGRAQAALLEVPDREGDALGATPTGACGQVQALFAAVAAEGRSVLTEPEAKAVLAAYGVPVPEIRVGRSPAEVAEIASEMRPEGGRLVVKLLSRSVSHKSDVGGVVLDVPGPAEAAAAARGIALRAGAAGATVDGFAVQPMIRRPEGQELILGVGRDPVFGPVILFGTGGIAVEILGDTAVALPPLDSALALELVERTRAGTLLAGYRGRPPADIAAVQAALVALSHLVEDFPCLRTIDVNPLIADPSGALALDARIEIDPTDMDRRPPNPDLAIRPYPGGWRRTLEREGERFELRPIRPVDALLYRGFLAHVDANDIRLRFMAPRRNFPDEMGLRLSQLDYDREMAFVALTAGGELAGVSRMVCDPDHRTAEYALLVRSDLKGRGLGTALMEILIDYARADGLERLDGLVLRENRGMLGLVGRIGFQSELDPEDPSVVRTWLDIGPAAALAEPAGGS
jgi:acetyltransferase